MIAISLLSLGVAILLAAITVLSVAATRSTLQPAVVNPFGPAVYDADTDTLPMGASSCENTLGGDWHSVELNRLSDVEAFLDSLEAGHASSTELEMTGNNRFTVRWR